MIGYLARNISDQAVIQHPYIPPRILSYQIKRFNECLDDFFAYQTQIISAFEWLSHAYNTNSEIMETTSMEVVFCSPFHKTLEYKNRITYPTDFNGFLKDYGLYELFSKWLLKEKLKSKETYRVSRFGKYFNLIRAVSIFYILNFSLQRRDEACSMRADCFSIENDHNNLFSTWIEQGKDFEVANVRDSLSAFNRLINAKHKKLFSGIFTTLETGLSKLGDTAAKQTKAISELIHLIQDIPTDGKQSYDVLGFIYEYLIGMFAANAGKKAGEFYIMSPSFFTNECHLHKAA